MPCCCVKLLAMSLIFEWGHCHHGSTAYVMDSGSTLVWANSLHLAREGAKSFGLTVATELYRDKEICLFLFATFVLIDS